MIKYVALLMSSPPGRQGGREGRGCSWGGTRWDGVGDTSGGSGDGMSPGSCGGRRRNDSVGCSEGTPAAHCPGKRRLELIWLEMGRSGVAPAGLGGWSCHLCHQHPRAGMHMLFLRRCPPSLFLELFPDLLLLLACSVSLVPPHLCSGHGEDTTNKGSSIF